MDPIKMEHVNSPSIKPLWHRFPSAFLYGLKPYPLLFAIGFSCFDFFIEPGIALTILLYAVLFKYAFEVMRRSSGGDLDPPPLNYSVLVDDYDLPIKMFLMMIFFGMLVFSVSSSIGAIAGLLLLFFGLFVYPASLMVLATTESMRSALNPLLLLAMVIRIRWTYLVLTGLLMLLSQAEMNLTGLISTSDPNPLASLLTGFAIVYFQLINFHMMGYVLYQSMDRLDGGASYKKNVNANIDTRLTLYKEFMDQGKTQAAIGELKTLIQEYPEEIDLHKRLNNLLLMEQQIEAAAQHASRGYIPKLLEQGKDFQAAEVYIQCMTRNAQIKIRSSRQVIQLTKALRGIGKGKQAIQLINGFHKSFPGSDDVVNAYILGAKICCEDLNRDDLAKKLLEYILNQYPAHPKIDEANKYLAHVSSLQC
jgi:tetratricopeptide (TPR) repeat protein